jgi:predicted transcriptional regulator
MNTDEIKVRLHESIENIDDEAFLLTIKELLEHKYQPTDPPILTEWQIKRIEESESQIQKGEFYTNDEVDKITRKWLDE